MRILVFGNSDTRGAVVSGPTWPELVRRELESASGETVELLDRNFVPVGPRAPEIAERSAREAAADIVLLPLSEYAFWARTVELRVQRIFGRRAARWFRAAERRVDSGAAKTGTPGARAKAALRWTARRVVGRGALASPGQVTATYRETLARLARVEDIDVVVIAYPLTPLPIMDQPKMRAARQKFIADVRSEAESRRFRWVDGDQIIAEAGLTPATAYHPDRVHIGAVCHDLFARAILAALPTPAATRG